MKKQHTVKNVLKQLKPDTVNRESAIEFGMKNLHTVKASYTETEVEIIPNCDVCNDQLPHTKTPATIDGKTTNGPWAYMCEKHFKEIGLGLSLGLGQRLKLRTK